MTSRTDQHRTDPNRTDENRTGRSAEQRRRKRRERAAKSRTPEPKNIVGGAGQPLDPGVRRELEESLGHDLSRVRLHTGRDAGHLTDLLGADAVAVGQDVFFREGAYAPGTAEGRRLLAHELLHTVQNPHGLGALRAGREPGAVSLPQQAVEREAEGAARDLVRGEAEADVPVVEEGQATPGWLRYATVDADHRRAEALDPATVVDRLANSLVRSLRGDPEDLSQRVRKQLSRMPETLLDGVLARLETRLLGPEHDRVLDLVDAIEAYDDFADDGVERTTHDAPEIEPDTAEQVRAERENALRTAEEREAARERPTAAPGPEEHRTDEEGAAGSTPQNGGVPGHGTAVRGGLQPRPASRERAPGAPRQPGPLSGTASGQGPTSSAADSGERTGGGAGPRSGEQKPAGAEAGRTGESGGKDRGGGREEAEQQETPTAGEEESAAENRPGAAEAAVAGRQLGQQDRAGQHEPTGSPAAAGRDTRLPGARSRLDGVRNQDLPGVQEKDDEADPFGSGSESEVEAGREEPSAWDVGLQPEDFLPQRDLDVSGVPTADRLDPSSSGAPSVPSFPAPPPTRAEQVRAERDAEDAEDEAARAESEEESAGVGTELEPPARETEGGPDGGTGPGGAALEQAAVRPAPGTRDPKSGDDPKAGPVVAQTTVQEAPGKREGGSEGGGGAGETAAKEEKGTAAAGDKGATAPEKESPQAKGGRSAQSEAGASEVAGGAGGGSAEAGAQEASGVGGTTSAHGRSGGEAVSGTTNPPESPGTSGASATPATSGTSGTSVTGPDGSTRAPGNRTEAPARTETPAPARPASAPAPAAQPERASVKAAAEPRAERESAPAPGARGGGGGTGATGGGGGAGRGAGATPARGRGRKDSSPAPNLSGVSPEAGLATASKLRPHKALQAMGGVSGAVDRTVGDEHTALKSAPPSMQRPAGAPQTLRGKPKTDAPAEYAQDKPQEAQAPEAENAEVKGAKEPEGRIEAEKAEEPGGWDTFKMALGFIGGKIVNGVASLFGADEPVVDPQELAAKFAGLPTKDEALKQARAGNAPDVGMQGAAEGTAGEQDGHVDAKGRETVATARDDSARGMGEDQVHPHAPKEEMRARVPGAQGGEGVAADGGGATGAVPPEAASEVAEHERGPQFQAAFSDGRKTMSEGRQTKDRDFRDSQAKHKRQVDAEIASNTETQAAEREKAMGQVTAQREGWRKEQDEELKSLGDKKSERQDKVRKDVEKKEKETDDNVGKEKEGSDKKIQDESEKAERDAEKQRDGAVQDSGNWVTRAFEWIKQRVIEIKNAIVRVIRTARNAVIGFIKNFKETVERWINEARKNILDAIRSLVDALIEFAVAMVRAVVELAARIRKFITDLVAAAIALVNRLAQALKQAVTDLLDAIGKLLSSILDALKKALLAAVKTIVAAVRAVLQFASRMLSALGEFMLVAVDFVSDPGGWLSGAKNSAVDGAKNHLFREVKAAVKDWFQSKIEEIIGVPRAVLDKLVKGGITLERIVKETWDAIVPQLPLIIGEIVITKVIAKLIPGAGWVMAVIDAVRTAIGALGEILRAMGAVLDWLKAVRSGGAGILFAKAVAAGIVALLELAYEALLSGIGKYVAKVGRRFKDIAAKLGGKGNDTRAGGKGGADGAVDKGTDRKPQADPTKKPLTDARPTTTASKPGRPEQGIPGKPTTSTDPERPTSTTTKEKNGKPKDKDEKPDTRPTPAADPKPKARPKAEPGARQKSTDGRRQEKPGDDRGTGTSEPKDQDPLESRSADKGNRAPSKLDQSNAKAKDNNTPDRRRSSEDGGGRPKPKHEVKHSKRPEHDRHEARKLKGQDAEKERRQKKDQRKKEENSKERMDERLQKIVARIRPRVDGMLRQGTGRPLFRAALAAMRAWYRLTELSAGENERFHIEARLNPTASVANGLQMDTIELADAVDAMVDHVLRRDQVIAQSRRIGPPAGTVPVAARTRVVPTDVGTVPMLRNMMDDPMTHRQPETFQIEAGDSQYNSRLVLQRTERHGGGTILSREGSDERPSYRQESKALRDAEPDGALMGARILEAMSGNRDQWQGNDLPDVGTLDQAVFTATLIGLIETGRTPFTMVPNMAAVSASKLGGPHIADLVGGLPLSGPAARFNKKDMVAKYGRDSYEVIGGQAAGRQTEWLLAARRRSDLPTYRENLNTTVGVSVSETIGKGFLSTPKIKREGHHAPEIDELTKKFKGVPGWMIQKAYNLGGQHDMRVGPALWEKVGTEIKNKTELQPPSRASEEVLRRTAANLKVWADARRLVYAPSDPKAKGKFLVEIYRELVGIVGISADGAFEDRLGRGY